VNVQPELTVVCRFQDDGEYLDSSIVAAHWLSISDDKTTCWYPPGRWQNKPGQFRIQPTYDGPGEWFAVSQGHVHLREIRTLVYKQAHQWLEDVRIQFGTWQTMAAELVAYAFVVFTYLQHL